jgi:hypothetical protein
MGSQLWFRHLSLELVLLHCSSLDILLKGYDTDSWPCSLCSCTVHAGFRYLGGDRSALRGARDMSLILRRMEVVCFTM